VITFALLSIFYLKSPRADMIDEFIEGSSPNRLRYMYNLYMQKCLHIMKDAWRSCTSTSPQKFWFGVQTMALPKLGRRYRLVAILWHSCSVHCGENSQTFRDAADKNFYLQPTVQRYITEANSSIIFI
jgi:hypothetical protein